jgi:hypothetical protein
VITAGYLRKILRYEPTTGKWFWLRKSANMDIGDEAGSLHKYGYIHIHIDQTIYKAHRLAWLYQKGRMPKSDIEHKDRNKSNNRWTNLRLANDSKNQANTSVRIDNTTGFKSVQLRKDSGKYRVRIQVRGKRVTLGHFDTPELAHAAYVAAAKKHFGEFACAA